MFYHTAYEEWGIEEESAGMLYVVDTEADTVWWYDNSNSEWHKSLHKFKDIKNDKDFTEVKKWSNGHISVHEAENKFCDIDK